MTDEMIASTTPVSYQPVWDDFNQRHASFIRAWRFHAVIGACSLLWYFVASAFALPYPWLFLVIGGVPAIIVSWRGEHRFSGIRCPRCGKFPYRSMSIYKKHPGSYAAPPTGYPESRGGVIQTFKNQWNQPTPPAWRDCEYCHLPIGRDADPAAGSTAESTQPLT